MKKRKFLVLGILASFAVFFAACGGADTPAEVTPQTPPTPPAGTGDAGDTVAPAGDARLAQHGLDENLRFIEPVTLRVGLWDRSSERVPEFHQSYWAEWVQAQILEAHNIIVEWVTIPRWQEMDHQSMLLAGGEGPDIGYTFSLPMVTTFAEMGGMMNLYPLLQQYGDWLPHMYALLGENVYWNLNPDTGELFSITGRLIQNGRLMTFIREDWLNALNLPIPTNLEEFEFTLHQFRDRQDELPAPIAGFQRSVVPYGVANLTPAAMGLLTDSLIPSDISERDWFVYGFDAWRFHHEDAIREATRIFNRWFHDGLIEQDFVTNTDAMPYDLIRLGYVGAFVALWDLPFRPADAHITTLRENVGPEANLIPITPFLNDQGVPVQFLPNPVDRFIYFPTTNSNPVASLLYLDWISRPDVREFLQFGVEGIHRETQPNGGIAILGETDTHSWPDNMFIPSLNNFDITMTINGFDLGDDYLTAFALANAYPGISPEAVMTSRSLGLETAYWFRQVSVRTILAEEGMGVLEDQRNVMIDQMVAAVLPENFDAEWNARYQANMALGGAAIIAERHQAWIETFGDVDNRPGR